MHAVGRTNGIGLSLLIRGISRLCDRGAGLVAMDAVAIIISSSAAYLVGTMEGFPPKHLLIEGEYVLFMLAMRLPTLALTGVYKSIWKYGGLSDALRVAKGIGLGTFAAAVGLIWLEKIATIGPILLIDSLLILCAVMALRMAVRCGARAAADGPVRKTLIVGAGDAGQMVVKLMLDRPDHAYLPVGFLDDDPGKKGKTIHGVPVLGSCADAARIADNLAAQAIVIATPSASGRQMRAMVEECSAARLPMQTVPAIKDILDGKIRISQIRQVCVTDLINRKPMTHDRETIKSYLGGKAVLVTGAAGSIGSELCRMILDYGPSTLIALDISENGLFDLRQQLAEVAGDCRLVEVVSNTQNGMAIDSTLKRFRPHLVFHAAAHKHVPLMEANPEEAVVNNVRGAMNVALACERAGVEKMVNISTDKAVNPTSIMGASKRLVEMFIQDISRSSDTKFCTVRFGNVLESNGSVLPLFRRQIAKGGPVTVTHPSIRRFFMTIPEAVSLVLQAAAMGNGGEVFVLDMGEQIKIADLAKHLIALSGFEPCKDIEIAYTGLRPGEKIYEELWEPGECPRSTSHRNILVVKPCSAPRNLQASLRLLLHYADTLDRERMLESLKVLIPAYSPQFAGSQTRSSRHAGASGTPMERADDDERDKPLPTIVPSRPARPARRFTLSTAVGRRV